MFLLVPSIEPLRMVVPLEQTVPLVSAVIAGSALVAWWWGGRVSLAAIWLVASVWMLSRPLHTTPAYDALARGWTILLASVFAVICLVGGRRTFLSRALSTLALTFAIATGVVLVSSVAPSRVQRVLGDELNRRAADWDRKTSQREATPAWQRFSANYPSVARFIQEKPAEAKKLRVRTLQLFPALLALESLVALALGWGLFHRISRTRIGPPLAPLKQFRLSNQLVWGFVAGLLMVTLPSMASVRGLGLNLLVFFGLLYALRGLGVLAWFTAPRGLAGALLVVLGVIFWPVIGVVAAVSFGLGLADTWIDWRARLRPLT